MEKDYQYNHTSYEHPVHVPSQQKGEKTILSELDNYVIDPDVKHRAQSVYQRMGPRVHRGNKRMQLFFYCCYSADLELYVENPEIREDPNPLTYQKMFGLTHGEARKAGSIFSEAQTGYRQKTGKANPLGMIRGYCIDNQINEEHIAPLKALGRKILKQDPELYEKHPQTVAAGLIKYGLSTMGCIIDKDSFAENVGLSNATINGMCKRIAKIDNAHE